MNRQANDLVGAALEIADAIDGLAHALRNLGLGDASTPFGAIEAHGALLKEELVPMLCGSLEEAARIIAEGRADDDDDS